MPKVNLKTHFQKNHALAESLLSRVFSWDVVNVKFPTCSKLCDHKKKKLFGHSVRNSNVHPVYCPKTGSKLGLSGPKRLIVAKFIKIGCLQWSLLGCMALKQGLNWGYRAQNGVINWVVIPLTLNQGQICVMGP
jgi:hypothetical protein